MTETAKQEKINQESKQEQRYYYTVMEEQEGMRLDQFLAAELKEHSRSYIQKLIKEGQVQVGEKNKTRIPSSRGRCCCDLCPSIKGIRSSSGTNGSGHSL